MDRPSRGFEENPARAFQNLFLYPMDLLAAANILWQKCILGIIVEYFLQLACIMGILLGLESLFFKVVIGQYSPF